MKAHSEKYWTEIETWPRERIKELQNLRFLEKIKNPIPWYQNFWREHDVNLDDIQSIDDITKLPLTPKALVKETQQIDKPYGMWNYETNLSRTGTTSGSTGNPLLIPYTKEAYHNSLEGGARGLWASGIRGTDIVHGIQSFNTILGVYFLHDICEQWFGSMVVPAGSIHPLERLAMINFYNVNVVMGTPTTLIKLGEMAKTKSINLSVEKLVTTGEPGPICNPSCVDELKELWGAKTVGDLIGTQEAGGCFAFQCEYGSPHANEDMAHFEVIDGKLYMTPLLYLTAQLFRYEVGDHIVSIDDHDCECGRTLKILNGYEGHMKHGTPIKYSNF